MADKLGRSAALLAGFWGYTVSANDSAKKVPISELPIYDLKQEEPRVKPMEFGNVTTAIAQTVSPARQAVCKFLAGFEKPIGQTKHVLSTGKAHTMSTVHQLQDADSKGMTIIAASALLPALLFGRTNAKRFFYAVFGGAIGASLYYPYTAIELSTEAYTVVKNKVTDLVSDSGKKS